jgi:(E)-4-hydroxy-3-methylbut-2-enyl-diphosphate synthase
MTDIGFTGGGKDSGMVYLDGKKVNKLINSEMVDKIVELVEIRAREYDSNGRLN